MHNVVLLIKYICLIVDLSEGYDVDKAGASEKFFFFASIGSFTEWVYISTNFL